MESFIEIAESVFVLGLMIYGIYLLIRNFIKKQNEPEASRTILDTPIPMPIPDDIKNRVVKLYSDEQEQNEAMEIIHAYHEGTKRLNVGPSQFCRAILTLANNNIGELRRLADLPEDPRDIIRRAEARVGNPKHYFIPPFDD